MLNILYLDYEDDVIYFCKKHKSIYLYGAGDFGRIYYEYLVHHGVDNIKGFLVTKKIEKIYCGIPVYEMLEYQHRIGNDCGIILTLSRKYHDEILENNNFHCELGFCDDSMIQVFSIDRMFQLLERLSQNKLASRVGNVYDGQKILVVQVEHTYGDIIWSSGFLRELRANFPNSHITMIINLKMLNLFSRCPYVDEFIGFDLKRGADDVCSEKDCEYVMDFCNNKNFDFDVVYLPRLLPCSLQEIWENIFLAIASRAEIRVAHMTVHEDHMKKIFNKFDKYFTAIVKHEIGEHEALRNIMLLSKNGVAIKRDEMELWLNEGDISYAQRALNLIEHPKNKMLFAVGLVGSNPARSWPPEKYNRVFKKISTYYPNVIFVLCGGLDGICAAKISQKGIENNCIDLVGKTSLVQVAAIVSQCDAYIGSDTGIMHMAAAFKKPIVELSHSLPDAQDTCGSHPVRTGPWRVPGIILRPPHGLGKCHCVCGKRYAHCIDLIKVEDVYCAVEKMICNLKGDGFI